MEAEKRLAALKQQVVNCTACEFSQTRTQVVFGEGPLGSLLMSVSEAPGSDEDREGRPYQGRAGKYWEGMLGSVKLDRNSIYVCNALKCRPLQNTIPDDYHNIHACNIYLLTQIAIIQPKIILAFGKVAAYALGIVKKASPLGSVTGNLRTRTGEPFKYVNFKGVPCTAELIVTYHPSYLMRGGLEQQKASWRAYNHLAEAKEIFDGMVIPQITK